MKKIVKMTVVCNDEPMKTEIRLTAEDGETLLFPLATSIKVEDTLSPYMKMVTIGAHLFINQPGKEDEIAVSNGKRSIAAISACSIEIDNHVIVDVDVAGAETKERCVPSGMTAAEYVG